MDDARVPELIQAAVGVVGEGMHTLVVVELWVEGLDTSVEFVCSYEAANEVAALLGRAARVAEIGVGSSMN